MVIDISQLENTKNIGEKTTARCPACAESGKDRKGNHLFIDSSGRFGCIVYPGVSGKEHRKRIFQLVGLKIKGASAFKIKSPVAFTPGNRPPIQKGILGHLGRVKPTYARKKEDKIKPDHGVNKTVPDVPAFTKEEDELLRGIDQETIRIVLMAKKIFNGTVVAAV